MLHTLVPDPHTLGLLQNGTGLQLHGGRDNVDKIKINTGVGNRSRDLRVLADSFFRFLNMYCTILYIRTVCFFNKGVVKLLATFILPTLRVVLRIHEISTSVNYYNLVT